MQRDDQTTFLDDEPKRSTKPKVDPAQIADFARALKEVYSENGIDVSNLKFKRMKSGFHEQLRPKLSAGFDWPTPVRNFYSDYKAEIHEVIFSNSQDTTEVKPEAPQRKELPHLRDYDKRINELIDQRLDELRQALLSESYGIELCPARSVVKIPHKRGKTENRKSVDIATSLDEELYVLFQKDRQKLGCSESMLLDTILWHFYKKPKLSYELDPLRQEPPKVKKK